MPAWLANTATTLIPGALPPHRRTEMSPAATLKPVSPNHKCCPSVCRVWMLLLRRSSGRHTVHIFAHEAPPCGCTIFAGHPAVDPTNEDTLSNGFTWCGHHSSRRLFLRPKAAVDDATAVRIKPGTKIRRDDALCRSSGRA